ARSARLFGEVPSPFALRALRFALSLTQEQPWPSKSKYLPLANPLLKVRSHDGSRRTARPSAQMSRCWKSRLRRPRRRFQRRKPAPSGLPPPRGRRLRSVPWWVGSKRGSRHSSPPPVSARKQPDRQKQSATERLPPAPRVNRHARRRKRSKLPFRKHLEPLT